MPPVPQETNLEGLEGTWKGLGTDLEGTWQGLGKDLEGTWKDLEGTWPDLDRDQVTKCSILVGNPHSTLRESSATTGARTTQEQGLILAHLSAMQFRNRKHK